MNVASMNVASMNVDSVEVERIGVPVSGAEIESFMARLGVASPAESDGERIDRIGALEGLKAASAAAQARDIVLFADSQLEDQAVRGVRAKDRGTGIASQVGLACRQSPHRGSRMLATARALLIDLPRTFEALSRGETSEFRASLVAKETAILDAEHRRRVDEELGPRLHELGDRRVEAEARGWACRLDPEAAVKRASKAHRDRRVTIRPAPDTMTYLTGLLPVCDGVAVYAALDAAAKAAAAAGDSRARGQVMADTLVHRVTGTASAEHPVEISIVMTDRTLLEGGDEPAQVPGYGPVPAEIARCWIRAALDLDDGDDGDGTGADDLSRRERARRHERGKVWLQRLFATPDGRHLVAMDSRRRHFPRRLRQLIELRDQTCATPYCGAPIRHIDHIEPARREGVTSYVNGRGTCARCNHAKEAPGWSAGVTDTTRANSTDPSLDQSGKRDRVVTLTTPTGHSYANHSPPVHHGAPARAG
ncbi:MAG: DUF222 domain-containing protein [Dermatophilaceae bacterium]|nr:DUF222 domain-containing protein [Intrasporangiaceae bacterium]